MKKTLFAAAICGAVFSALAFAAGATVVEREGFKPFTIISTKLNKVLKSSSIEKELMCRSVLERIPDYKFMVSNFDIISTSGDSSMGIVTYRGEQNGKPVQVTFMTTVEDHVLKYIWVDGEPTLSCKS